MAVRKDEKKGKWLAEAYIDGKRTRRWFDSKGEANRFYNAIKQENSPLFKMIQAKTPEFSVRLSEMVDQWWQLHGCYLSERSFNTRDKLKRIALALGDPYAEQLTAEHFVEFRKRRLSGEIKFLNTKSDRPLSVKTANMDLRIFTSMINVLIRLKKWKWANPLKELREFKTKERELYFLRNNEIKHLLAVCEQHSTDLAVITRICLSTGARWREAQNLKSSQVIPYKITFVKTKGGKNRTVPISKALYDLIPKKQGPLFSESNYALFKKVMKLTGISLPRGQCSHVLRHTFASHFMMNGGNILVLKDILGHSNINITMRYAHFAPSYLETAISLNPLENLEKTDH